MIVFKIRSQGAKDYQTAKRNIFDMTCIESIFIFFSPWIRFICSWILLSFFPHTGQTYLNNTISEIYNGRKPREKNSSSSFLLFFYSFLQLYQRVFLEIINLNNKKKLSSRKILQKRIFSQVSLSVFSSPLTKGENIKVIKIISIMMIDEMK